MFGEIKCNEKKVKEVSVPVKVIHVIEIFADKEGIPCKTISVIYQLILNNRQVTVDLTKCEMSLKIDKIKSFC